MSAYKSLLVVAMLTTTCAFARPAKTPKPPPLPASIKLCEACHGANGVSPTPSVPHLNGQIPEAITEAMEKFQAGKRPSSTPDHVNPALTAEEIEALAKYYSYFTGQRAQRPEQVTDAAKAASAATSFQRRCAKCHVDAGRQSEHDSALLAGQSLEYLKTQTDAFVNGKRKFPPQMEDAYKGLSREDLDNLSHFFASQQQQ